LILYVWKHIFCATQYFAIVVRVAAIFKGETAISLEQPEYTVIYKDGDVEYRQYEPYLVSETIIMKTALSNMQSANRTPAMNISQAS
jgi:hypothetical protein